VQQALLKIIEHAGNVPRMGGRKAIRIRIYIQIDTRNISVHLRRDCLPELKNVLAKRSA